MLHHQRTSAVTLARVLKFDGESSNKDIEMVGIHCPQNKYSSTVFVNLKIHVDVDGTTTFDKTVNNFIL